ncbi:hypothetical protein [Amycolatopsis sp. NPDC054798]
MMGFLEILEDVGHWVGERVDDLGKFYSAALYGNTGTEAMPAPELAQKVLAGPGTSVWHEGAGQAAQLSSQHHDASDLVSRMSTGLESAWTGRAADAAQTRIRALAEIASVSAAIYTTNGANLSDVAHGFDAMKTALQPMPDKPPHLTFVDRVSPWDTDAEKEINQYNAVAQQNIDRYQAYVQHARTGSQQLQTDYGRLDDFGGRNDTAGPHPKGRQGPDVAPHFPKPRSSGYPPDAPPPTPAPPVSGPSAPPPEHGLTQGHRDHPGPGGAPPPGTGDQTTASGWSPDPATPKVPPSYPGGSGSGGTAWSPGEAAGVPVQGGRGNLSGSTGGEIGRTSGKPEARDRTATPFRPGPGGGTGEEARSRTGGPPRSGTGEEGRPAGNATRGTTGTPGSRGAPGAGGIAPARGKDEEAKEHQRKYGVESDSAFTDDDGERIVDPRTGLPPTPPTIGG